MSRNALSWSAVLLAVATALAVGYRWGHSRQPQSGASMGSSTAARKVLYWYDPMLPDQHFNHPGVSPMGMQLVPRYAGAPGTPGVAVDPTVQQSLGIRTVPVERGHLESAIRVPGTITWDQEQERIISLPVDAIVRRLHVRTPFEPVHVGQPLAAVLAPTWSTAIAEARALRDAHSSAGRELQAAARSRLRALGIPAGATGSDGAITLRASTTGVVSEIGAREGQAVPAGTALFRINGTRSVWLEAALPQAALGNVQAGTPVEASINAIPGRRFKGTVAALLPQLDPASRTQRARIVLRNDEGLLIAGMYADVRLLPQGMRETLLVPTDAVIGGGEEARVIVQERGGRFRPVPVTLGQSAGGDTEVLAGLRGDERIVANGQFLIDSEASLSGALERLGSQREAKPVPTTTPSPAPKILYWYDPAMPEMHFDRPDRSSHSGLPLVPRYAEREKGT